MGDSLTDNLGKILLNSNHPFWVPFISSRPWQTQDYMWFLFCLFLVIFSKVSVVTINAFLKNMWCWKQKLVWPRGFFWRQIYRHRCPTLPSSPQTPIQFNLMSGLTDVNMALMLELEKLHVFPNLQVCLILEVAAHASSGGKQQCCS